MGMLVSDIPECVRCGEPALHLWYDEDLGWIPFCDMCVPILKKDQRYDVITAEIKPIQEFE